MPTISSRWARSACQYCTRPAPGSGLALKSPSPRLELRSPQLQLCSNSPAFQRLASNESLARVAGSAERDAAPDDGTDGERDGQPTDDTDCNEMRPGHRSDHARKILARASAGRGTFSIRCCGGKGLASDACG